MSRVYQGFNQEKIQAMNRTLILNLLRREEMCSRVHLAKESELKQATLTNMVNDFMRWGIVKETGFLTGDKGRRSIGISLNKEDFGILAIRLARLNYSVGVFDLAGELVKLVRRSIDKNQKPELTIERILKDARELLDQENTRRFLAIGVALPGPYSLKSGRIEIMTGTAGWNEIPIRERFEEQFSLPVFIEQDANAGAMAQYWKYAQEQPGKMLIYMALGQGVGAGIVHKGEIMRGAIGIAGEIGHTSIDYKGPRCACGNRGCLENYCSALAFVEKVNRSLKPEKPLDFDQAVVRFKDGDPVVTDIFMEICDILSIAVTNLINTFNPSIIVLGDQMAHIAPETMLARVREKTKEQVIPALFEETVITTSLLPRDSIAYGAAVIAINEIFSDPERFIMETGEERTE